MTQANYEEREIETTGRYQCITNVSATIYPHSIVATAEGEHITERQMERALNREFPRHTFVFTACGGGGDYIRCDADRFPNDGV